VVSADFNGDGFADVIALSTVRPPVSAVRPTSRRICRPPLAYSQLRLLRQMASIPCIWPAPTSMATGYWTWSLPASMTAQLDVFFNNKTSPGTFNPAVTLSSPGASQVAIADMNGDGLPDLVSADFKRVRCSCRPLLGPSLRPSAFIAAAPIGSRWGISNGDGAPDVATHRQRRCQGF